MRRVYFFIGLTLIANSLFAQELRVITTRFVGGDTSTCGINCRYSVATKDGGILFVGHTNCWNGGGDIPPSPPDTVGSSSNLLIGKLDSNMNISWVKVYGGNRDDIGIGAVQTTDGGYAVLALTRSYGGDISGQHGTSDYWLVRTDASGNLLWQKCYGSTSSEQPTSIATTPDNGFIMMGGSNGFGYDVPTHYSSSPFEHDWFVIKTDSMGNKQWSKSIGGTGNEELFGSILVANDAYYLVGSSESTDHDCVDDSWHPGVPTGFDNYIIKLDTSGNILWAKSYGCSGVEHVSNAVLDARDSSIVINGTTNGSNDYMVSGNHGYVDLWVVKVDKNGVLKWQKCLGGVNQEQGAGISLAPFGYIAYGSEIPGIISSYDDAWMFALDTAGNLLADKIFGGTGRETPASIIPFKGGFAATGYSSSQNFTEGNSIGDLPQLRGQAFFSYINYWPAGINNAVADNKPEIYPNPAGKAIKVKLPSERGTINIANNLGKTIYNKKIQNGKYVDIDISEWATGVYLVRWQGGGIMLTNKFIKA